MESKKTTLKTWYTRPTGDPRPSPNSSPRSLSMSPPRPPTPSLSLSPLSPSPPGPRFSRPPPLRSPFLPASSLTPPLTTSLTTRISVSAVSQTSMPFSPLPLPGFASFLPGYSAFNGAQSVRNCVGSPPTPGLPTIYGNAVRPCPPPLHSSPILSAALAASSSSSSSSYAISSSQLRVSKNEPCSGYHQATSAWPITGAVSCHHKAASRPITEPFRGKAEAGECNSCQAGSSELFRPVGVLLKTKECRMTQVITMQSAAKVQSASSNPTPPPVFYYPPPVCQHPWSPSTGSPQPSCSNSPTAGTKLPMDYKQLVSSYNMGGSGNGAQPGYNSVHPVSCVGPACAGDLKGKQARMARNIGSMAKNVGGIGSGDSSVRSVPKGNRPMALLNGASLATNVHLSGAKQVNPTAPRPPTDSGSNPAVSSPLQDAGLLGAYSSSAGRDSNSEVSVVTVKADHGALFMAHQGRTTSQTESHFSLHEAKMQLDQDPLPSSPFTFIMSGGGGGVVDRFTVQPTPGDEVKPHPGLDMLSDVSLLVESLTGGHRRKDSHHHTVSSSNSSTAISLCSGSYPSEDDMDSTLCAPHATFMGTLTPNPDSTVPIATANQPEDVQYTPMNAAFHEASQQAGSVLPEHYTLMLPPKKSGKFTRRAPSADSLPLPNDSTENSHKPSARSGKKRSSSQSNALKDHGKSKRNTDSQDKDKVTSKTKKRGRSKKERHSDEKSKACGSDECQQPTAPKAKKRRHKKTPLMTAQQNGALGEPGNGMKRSAKPLCSDQTAVDHKVSVTESDGVETGSFIITVLTSPSLPQTSTDRAACVSCKVEGQACTTTQETLTSPAQETLTSPPQQETLMSPAQASLTPLIEELTATSSGESLYVQEYEDDLCPKVTFDPMVIAEEEVTSTQPHDEVVVTQTINGQRRRLGSVLTAVEPSSDEASSPPHSARTKPRNGVASLCHSSKPDLQASLYDPFVDGPVSLCHQHPKEAVANPRAKSGKRRATSSRRDKPGKGTPRYSTTKKEAASCYPTGHSNNGVSAGTFGNYNLTKAGRLRCRRCQRVVSGRTCEVCDGRSSPSSRTTTPSPPPPSDGKGQGRGVRRRRRSRADAGERMPCQVCGRSFTYPSNLARHQRTFHPSLFHPSSPITEPLLLSTRSSSSSSLLSSLHSPCPSSSSSSSSSFPNNSKPSPHRNSPCDDDNTPRPCTPTTPSAEESNTDSQEEGGVGNQEGGVENQEGGFGDQASPPVDDDDDVVVVSKRRRLSSRSRSSSIQDDRDWQPPKSLPTALSSDGVSTRGQRKRRRRRKCNRVTDDDSPPTPTSPHDPLVYPHCPLNFRTKKRTRINSTIPCPHCEKTFSVMSNLKRHTKREHGDVNVFVCNVCHYKINMRRKLNKHMKLHEKHFPHTCLGCLARFRTDGEMMSHRKSHAIFRFPCTDCSLIFYTEEHLGDHMAGYHVTQVTD